VREPGLDHLQSWVGSSEEANDVIDPRRVAQMAATLGCAQELASGDSLPMPWHWLFFTPIPQAQGTGRDGHPSRGGFLPPVPLPRRMWAGSSVVQHRPLQIGQPARRISTVASVEAKQGRDGGLLFVTVDHALYTGDSELAVEEQQHIVYREPAPAAAAVGRAAADRDMPELAAQWESPLTPDPILLFRYSALTFNAHRIHYDLDYAMAQEGYPGLVVHGPLIASLLLQLAHDQLGGIVLREFSFRARRPLFANATACLCGARDGDMLTLWALTPERELAMRLDAIIASDGS
jgi:3-methylfumaryl-CoA hydratase